MSYQSQLLKNIAKAKAKAGGQGGKPPAAPPAPNPTGFHPKKIIAEIGETPTAKLTGQQLQQLARANTVLETRPVIHGYKDLANQLTGEREATTKGLGVLGKRTAGQVGSTYHSIATSEAQSLAQQQALQAQFAGQAQGIATQGQADLAADQQQALGGYTADLNLRGAPTEGGSAQAALAQAVAAQGANASTDLQAQQQSSVAQSAAGPALLAQIAAATQGEGGAAVGRIGKTVVNRDAESNKEFNSSIKTALGKLQEAKATKGATFLKNFGEAKEGQEKAKQAWAVIKGEKAAAGAAAQSEAADRAEKALERSEGKEERDEGREKWQKELGLSYGKLGLEKWEAHNPEAGKNKVGEKKKEIGEEVNEVRSILHNTVTAEGKGPKSAQELAGLVNYINGKTSAKPTLVSHVLQNWWLKNRTHGPGATHR